jgi:hypothetical protein
MVDHHGFLTFDFHIYNFFVSKAVLCFGKVTSFIFALMWMTQVFDVIVYQNYELLHSVAQRSGLIIWSLLTFLC